MFAQADPGPSRHEYGSLPSSERPAHVQGALTESDFLQDNVQITDFLVGTLQGAPLQFWGIIMS